MKIRNCIMGFLTFTRQTGENGVEVRIQNNDVWLIQASIAKLFSIDRTIVIKYLKKSFPR